MPRAPDIARAGAGRPAVVLAGMPFRVPALDSSWPVRAGWFLIRRRIGAVDLRLTHGPKPSSRPARRCSTWNVPRGWPGWIAVTPSDHWPAVAAPQCSTWNVPGRPDTVRQASPAGAGAIRVPLSIRAASAGFRVPSCALRWTACRVIFHPGITGHRQVDARPRCEGVSSGRASSMPRRPEKLVDSGVAGRSRLHTGWDAHQFGRSATAISAADVPRGTCALRPTWPPGFAYPPLPRSIAAGTSRILALENFAVVLGCGSAMPSVRRAS